MGQCRIDLGAGRPHGQTVHNGGGKRNGRFWRSAHLKRTPLDGARHDPTTKECRQLEEGTRMAVLPDLFILLPKFHLGTMPLVKPNTLLATFSLGLWVILDAVEVQFALQLAVGGPARCVEHATVQRLDDGATGLGIMGAIMKSALGGKRLDVGEGRRHPVAGIPQTQLAHARRIEQQRTAGQQYQFAMGVSLSI